MQLCCERFTHSHCQHPFAIMSHSCLARMLIVVTAAVLLGARLDLVHGGVAAASFTPSNTNPVQVQLRNDSPLRLQVGWVNVQEQSIQHMGFLEPFGTVSLNAIEGHEFELLEMPNTKTGNCNHLAAVGRTGVETLQLKAFDGCALNTFRVGQQAHQCTWYSCCGNKHTLWRSSGYRTSRAKIHRFVSVA